jgi:hypothetical protein
MANHPPMLPDIILSVRHVKKLDWDWVHLGQWPQMKAQAPLEIPVALDNVLIPDHITQKRGILLLAGLPKTGNGCIFPKRNGTIRSSHDLRTQIAEVWVK